MKLRVLSLALVGLALMTVSPLMAQDAEATPEATATEAVGYQVPGFPPFVVSPAMLNVVEDKGDTLVVEHLRGTTEIPKNPQRIYADASTLDILISLGITPVGANSSYVEGEEPSPELTPLLEGIELFPRGPGNLESILSLKPDLILVWDIAVTWITDDPEGYYEQLSAIAPTIVLRENSFTFWQQATRDIATLFGAEDKAEAVISAYQEAVTEQCDRMRTVIEDGETLSFILVQPDMIRLMAPGYITDNGYIPSAVTAWAYIDCEFVPGDEVSVLAGENFGIDLSLEVLPELQADNLAVIVSDGAEDTYKARVEQPLWQAVPAVQAGQAFEVPFLIGSSYYSAVWTLEQVANAITGETAS